jgi:hypothetical protein
MTPPWVRPSADCESDGAHDPRGIAPPSVRSARETWTGPGIAPRARTTDAEGGLRADYSMTTFFSAVWLPAVRRAKYTPRPIRAPSSERPSQRATNEPEAAS